MAPLLDERSRRRWAASEARMIGRGGVSAVAEATGLARRTIYRGLDDLSDRVSAKAIGYADRVAGANRG